MRNLHRELLYVLACQLKRQTSGAYQHICARAHTMTGETNCNMADGAYGIIDEQGAHNYIYFDFLLISQNITSIAMKSKMSLIQNYVFNSLIYMLLEHHPIIYFTKGYKGHTSVHHLSKQLHPSLHICISLRW